MPPADLPETTGAWESQQPDKAEQKSEQQDGNQSSSADSTEEPITFRELCEVCSTLDIRRDRFVITNVKHAVSRTHPNAPLQRTASSIQPSRSLILMSGAQSLELGSMRSVEERGAEAHCGLCDLIVRVISRYTQDDRDISRVNCRIRWEVDGREGIATPESRLNRTRRLRLIWTDETSRSLEAFLVFVGHSNPLAPNSDAHGWRERTFLGREIEEGKGKQALLKSWLDLCRDYHGHDCKVKVAQSQEFDKILDETYFGVIDVVNMQLTPLPRSNSNGKPATYAALSYVWGNGELPYQTERWNAPVHRQHGGLEPVLKQLPQAVQDAISLVQKLGVSFLWVDALCIVQDSSTSFKLNAQAMHAIYGNAVFTICAADGKDASTGLVALRQPSPSPRPSSTHLSMRPDSKVSVQGLGQLNCILPGGVQLQASRPAEMVIRDSVWNTRAWTYQERILSRRCFVFAEGRAYFQCRKTSMSEDFHNEATGSSWSLQSMGAPLHQFLEMEHRAFSFYSSSVSQFYERQLTRPADILSAYKGVESVLRKAMRAPFCWGLPTSHLDLALLWEPLEAIERRDPTGITHASACPVSVGAKCSCIEDPGFPSWSWCGWIGGRIGYNSTALEGSLRNVREWLRDHTWIRWYIRDGRGRLRPLWDRHRIEEDISKDRRWRGYAGLNVMSNDTSELDGEDKDHASDSPDSTDDRRASSKLERDGRKRGRGRTKHLGFLERSSPPILGFFDPTTTEAEHQRDEVRYGDDIVEVEELHLRSRQEWRDPESAWMDDWGRQTNGVLTGKALSKDEFRQILPENPFGVMTTTYAKGPSQRFPDMPVLQFWTLRAMLKIVKNNEHKGLTRCDVGDRAGDWCGSMTVDSDWACAKQGSLCSFIALSEAMAFTHEECPVWTYYVPCERSESEWDIFYVMLIEWDRNKHVWTRVGVGKVFQVAFVQEGFWEEIILG